MNYINDIDFCVEEGIYNCFIEMTNRDWVKYRIDKSGNFLEVVESFDPVSVCPFSFGFIPRTGKTSEEVLRSVVITPEPLQRLSLVKIRPLGKITVLHNGVREEVIISVPSYSTIKKISIGKVISFFKNVYYKDEDVKLGNYKEDQEIANKIIVTCHEKGAGEVLDKKGVELQEDKKTRGLESSSYSPAPIKAESVEVTYIESKKEEATPQQEATTSIVENSSGERSDIERDWFYKESHQW